MRCGQSGLAISALQAVPSDDAGRAEAVVAAGTTVIEMPHATDLRLADEPDVPELCEDPGSRVVHLLNHPPQSVESVIAVDAGSVFIVSRARMHASGRHGAGHWGHRDAVAQIETADPSRPEQDFERVRDLHLDGRQFVLLRGHARMETAPPQMHLYMIHLNL